MFCITFATRKQVKTINIMTKAELVKQISKETGIENNVVMTVVESFMECVKADMSQGNEVFLRGFGSFILKKRAQKTARNITKNTSVIVPAHNIPFFKPSPEFKTAVEGTEVK